MSTRINLWCGPRNISTALMYSFGNRPDTTVIDEPLYGYYLKETGIWHPGYEEIINSMPTDLDEVKYAITCETYPTEVIVFKQMCHHLLNSDFAWIEGMRNIILIRHPALVIKSLAKVISNIALSSIGIKLQYELLNDLLARNEHVVVVDSISILDNPGRTLQALCDSALIPFDGKMLKWPAGPKKEDGIWAKYWYANAHASTGFADATPQDDDVPAEYAHLLNDAEHYYWLLKEHEIK